MVAVTDLVGTFNKEKALVGSFSECQMVKWSNIAGMSALAPQLLRDALLVELLAALLVVAAAVARQAAVVRVAARTREPSVRRGAELAQTHYPASCLLCNLIYQATKFN